MVMARAGDDLEAHRRTLAAMSSGDVAAILADIVEGLVEVGELVHRDLKPANVLRHENRWKIADFGIARFYEEATASNTLKDAMSPYYAAPEQWRYQRATHATDLYALGCIGFFLVTGRPPFVKNPEHEHQTAPIPPLASGEPRLDALITMLLRKPPETRPSLTRTKERLGEIRRIQANPSLSTNAASALSAVGARLAHEAHERESKQAEETRIRESRRVAAAIGRDILKDNLERLWGNIHSMAPTAERARKSDDALLRVSLGIASLTITAGNEYFLPVGGKWDVILGGQLIVQMTGRRAYKWSTSLWYGSRPGHDLRWFEVGYFSPFQGGDAPFALPPTHAPNAAGSTSVGGIDIACGPWPIDDESEPEFHDRVIWLLAKAARGELQHPSHIPIGDWSSFAR
ncbi:MAG: Serine/threonine protein kinase [Gemmatimonadetes bacterium]|nr:Serine/threonine protein kinase [Gemmatimonadota bacterium]